MANVGKTEIEQCILALSTFLLSFMKLLIVIFISLIGGIRIFRIMDDDGNIIFEEEDESTDSVSPYFLINGTESEDRVRWICEFIDRELAASFSLTLDRDDIKNQVENNFYPSWDGKLTRE